MRRSAILAVCLGLVLISAPAFAQNKAAMQQLVNQWTAAANKGDVAAVAAMYAKDAYVLPPGGKMVTGAKDIEAFWKEALADAQDVQCTTVDVKPLGGSAAREIGTCSYMTKKPPLKEVELKYAVVWEKEGGKWKLLQDIWNMDK